MPAYRKLMSDRFPFVGRLAALDADKSSAVRISGNFGFLRTSSEIADVSDGDSPFATSFPDILFSTQGGPTRIENSACLVRK